MMIAFVGKRLSSLILKHTSPYVSRSPPVHFFSASIETQIFSTPAVFDILVNKYSFPSELASRVASELSHLKTTEIPVSILLFFKESGFSNTQLGRIVKYRPRILSGSLEGTIKPKIESLQDAGFSSNDICKIISCNPRILDLSVKNIIIPSLSLLKGLLESNEEVATVIKRSPFFLRSNLESFLGPNIEFFKSYGIPMKRILIILSCNPSCFAMKPEVVRRSAKKAEEMGLNANSENFIYAISTIARMSNASWELKLQAFRDLGYSDSDMSIMLRKAPHVFYASVEKLKKVTELLLATGKFNMRCIVNCPKSLACSIEKRYIPRFRILEILESKNLIQKWPTLSTVSMLSNDNFFKKFISPYPKEVTIVAS